MDKLRSLFRQEPDPIPRNLAEPNGSALYNKRQLGGLEFEKLSAKSFVAWKKAIEEIGGKTELCEDQPNKKGLMNVNLLFPDSVNDSNHQEVFEKLTKRVKEIKQEV